MKGKALYIAVCAFIVITAILMVFLVNRVSHKGKTFVAGTEEIKSETARAVIKATRDHQSKEEAERGLIRQEIITEIRSGSFKNEEALIKNNFRQFAFPTETNRFYRANDRIIVFIQYKAGKIERVYIENTVRDDILLIVVAIFLILLVVVGKSIGIKTMVALLIDLAILIFFLVPLVSKAFSPKH